MIVLFRAVRSWWRARQRKIDMVTVWPELIAQARDEQHAKRALAMHIAHDPAWDDLNDDEKRAFIERLPWSEP